MMRSLFGVMATGESLNGWAFRLASKRLFVSKIKAEEYFSVFAELCCLPGHFDVAKRESLQMRVIEYEVDDV